MPRHWIPFRGDDYSRENSKRYIPKVISVGSRILGIMTFIFIPGLFLFVSVIDYIEYKSGFWIFGFIIAGIIIVITIVALLDAKKIASKNRKKPD